MKKVSTPKTNNLQQSSRQEYGLESYKFAHYQP